jgi:16S rRNA (uracil1498-N3)-methyltransferase
MAVDQKVILLDGRGTQGGGQIISTDRRGVVVEVAKVSQTPRLLPELVLATALPKGSRQDVLIEKCTELGVFAIQPVITERSVVDASHHKLSRWRQIAIEAVKQSNQAWLPALHPPKCLFDVLEDMSVFDQILVTATHESPKAIPLSAVGVEHARKTIGFVGPEGGWTAKEFEAVVNAGGQPVTLGPNVLRIETAAIALCAAVHGLMRQA